MNTPYSIKNYQLVDNATGLTVLPKKDDVSDTVKISNSVDTELTRLILNLNQQVRAGVKGDVEVLVSRTANDIDQRVSQATWHIGG